MAIQGEVGLGRRQEVEIDGPTIAEARPLQVDRVRAPRKPDLSQVGAQEASLARALGSIGPALQAAQEEHIERSQIDGEVAFMEGKTEADIAASGNRYTMAGYQNMSVASSLNEWYTSESQNIANGKYASDSSEYRGYLGQSFRDMLKTVGGSDSYSRNILTAGARKYFPQLMGQHVKARNAFSQQQTYRGYVDMLMTTGQAEEASLQGASTPTVEGEINNTPSRAGTSQVAMNYTERDVDVMARTMIGEAAGEGPAGMRAVGQVLRNRVEDPRWGNTITSVALAEKQFSTWNTGAGGNSLARNAKPTSSIYKMAHGIAKQVLDGSVASDVGGATHYYSPAGMKALVKQGAQSNLVPGWWGNVLRQGGGSSIKIGGHLFAGRSRGGQAAPAPTAVSENMPRPQPRLGTPISAALPEQPVQEAQSDPLQPDVQVAPIDLVGDVQPPHDPPGTTTQAQDPAGQTGIQGETNRVRTHVFANPGLPPKMHAQAVSEAMTISLLNGDNSVYERGGGISALIDLGATPAQVRSVQSAYSKWQRADQNTYDAELEKELHDIQSALKNDGDFDSALEKYEGLKERYSKSDKWLIAQANKARTASIEAQSNIQKQEQKKIDDAFKTNL